MLLQIRSFKCLTTGLLAVTICATAATLASARQDASTPPSRGTQSPPLKSLTIGAPAPAFTLKDVDGQTHTLEHHRGKVVVLEWFNPTCAEVRHQHQNGTMKSLLREHEKDGIVWLAVNSTPAGQPGADKEACMKARTELGVRFPILMDQDAAVAKIYRAKLTPTVYVIDEEGVLRYYGAIDNAPNGKLGEGETKMINYLQEALNSVMEHSELASPRTESYGCPILPKMKG